MLSYSGDRKFLESLGPEKRAELENELSARLQAIRDEKLDLAYNILCIFCAK